MAEQKGKGLSRTLASPHVPLCTATAGALPPAHRPGTPLSSAHSCSTGPTHPHPSPGVCKFLLMVIPTAILSLSSPFSTEQPESPSQNMNQSMSCPHSTLHPQNKLLAWPKWCGSCLPFDLLSYHLHFARRRPLQLVVFSWNNWHHTHSRATDPNTCPGLFPSCHEGLSSNVTSWERSSLTTPSIIIPLPIIFYPIYVSFLQSTHPHMELPCLLMCLPAYCLFSQTRMELQGPYTSRSLCCVPSA